jgi:predicted transcriptional regulator
MQSDPDGDLFLHDFQRVPVLHSDHLLGKVSEGSIRASRASIRLLKVFIVLTSSFPR